MIRQAVTYDVHGRPVWNLWSLHHIPFSPESSMTLKHKPLFRRVIGSGDFTQELLARLSPVTELGHLRPPACDTTSHDVRRTRTASVESVVATVRHNNYKATYFG